MESLQNDELMINVALFKRYGIYQLFDPKSPKIFNYNTYRFLYMAYTIVVLCITIPTIIALIMEGIVDYTAFAIVIIPYNYSAHCIINIGIFVYKADTIWSLLDLTRPDFLKSRACRKYINIVYKYQKISTKITDYLNRAFIAATLIWMIYPLIVNMFIVSKNQNHCYDNIFNFKYPVSTNIYNQYYYVFFLMEVVVDFFLLIGVAMVNIFLVSFYFTLIAQYEVLACAYKNIGYEDNNEIILNKKENDVIEELKEIICDHSNVYIKLKIFFSVIWTIMVAYVVFNFIGIIAIIYSLVVIYMSVDLFNIISKFKLFFAFIALCADLFVWCYMCDILHDKIEAVNYGLYSCNWTKQDLKFKKLILLTMKMNNATSLNIRLTPTKLINLQLLTNIFKIAYNVVNVLLNTLNETN